MRCWCKTIDGRIARMLASTACVTLAAVAIAPRAALAVPVFANGQGGVSCQLCHNAPPNLNAYGRYILATNFTKGLDPHRQMRESLKDPVSVEGDLAGPNLTDPTVPKNTPSGRLLGAGYLGQDVTYYASVPIVSSGAPSGAVDQVWAAYNGFGKNGSLQVGKFPTPFAAPWLSQSLSLTNYAVAALPVGYNSVGVGDNRWGASYTQIANNGLVGTVAYLTNTGAVEGAFNTNTDAGIEGQSYVASLQYLQLGAHVTGSLSYMGGNYPLPSGAKNSFGRQMALISYSTSNLYSVNAIALTGNDRNPNDLGFGSVGSNGVSLETIVNPLEWLHFNVRYDRTNDGLGGIGNSYVSDVAFNPISNLVLTVENVSAVGQRPVFNYHVLYAGPWIRHPVRHLGVAATAGVTGTTAAAIPASGAGAAPATVAVAPTSGTGATVYSGNCIACHGATGQGGVGPSLKALASKSSLAETVAKIEDPGPGVMPKLYPATISASDVSAVAAYIRTAFK